MIDTQRVEDMVADATEQILTSGNALLTDEHGNMYEIGFTEKPPVVCQQGGPHTARVARASIWTKSMDGTIRPHVWLLDCGHVVTDAELWRL